MSSLIMWIDTQQARLFFLEPDGFHKEYLTIEGPEHMKEVFGRNHSWQESDERKFYQQVCERLRQSDAVEWMIVGSGVGRSHFQKYVEAHFTTLAPKIVSNESMEKAQDQDIIERGRAFFARRQTFQGVIGAVPTAAP